VKFTIVIPTLNRADVLLWSIHSVLEQKGVHDFNIIVSDNLSEDNTENLVKGLCDDRIKYICPSSRLSMSRHWEFAASFVEKTDNERLILFLGDDDILCSNAFNIATNIFDKYDVDALRRTTGYYFTPDCLTPYAGFLILPPINGDVEIRNSMTYLEQVSLGKINYGELPLLYHGFVRSTILGDLLNFGLLFAKAAPDIFSDINIAALNIKYASISYPLTLGVCSPKSNGLNFLDKKSAIGREFKTSSLQELEHSYHIDSIHLHVIDCLEHVIKKHKLKIDIDYNKFYYNIIKSEEFGVVKIILSSLVKITGKTPVLIYSEMFVLSVFRIKNYIPTSLKKLIRLIISLGNGERPPVESFSYFGDLRKEGISDPKGCIEFIESNVVLHPSHLGVDRLHSPDVK
jgi:glycosyltransferase involved in cell wall biosynthesis